MLASVASVAAGASSEPGEDEGPPPWLSIIQVAADEGDLAAMLELARRYQQGNGITANPEQAQYYYCRASRRGSAEGAYRLGRMLVAGEAGPANPELGLAWLRMAAGLGHIAAWQEMPRTPQPAGVGGRPFCDPGQRIDAPPATAAEAWVMQKVRLLAPGYGLDPALVLAVIRAESDFRSDAVSPKGAAGLMQLMPDTARRFGVRNALAAEDNLHGGMAYLRWLLAYFRGQVGLALAGYNAGEKAVDRYNGIPPYPETTAYVAAITRMYGGIRHPFDPQLSAPSPVVRQQEAALRQPSARTPSATAGP